MGALPQVCPAVCEPHDVCVKDALPKGCRGMRNPCRQPSLSRSEWRPVYRQAGRASAAPGFRPRTRNALSRSEERRVGKEGRMGWSADPEKTNKRTTE